MQKISNGFISQAENFTKSARSENHPRRQKRNCCVDTNHQHVKTTLEQVNSLTTHEKHDSMVTDLNMN